MTVITDELAREHIADNVNRLLKEKEKSKYWLAQQTGEWESRIGAVCNKKSLCSVAMASRIATALGVSVDDLMRKPSKKS